MHATRSPAEAAPSLHGERRQTQFASCLGNPLERPSSIETLFERLTVRQGVELDPPVSAIPAEASRRVVPPSATDEVGWGRSKRARQPGWWGDEREPCR